MKQEVILAQKKLNKIVATCLLRKFEGVSLQPLH